MPKRPFFYNVKAAYPNAIICSFGGSKAHIQIQIKGLDCALEPLLKYTFSGDFVPTIKTNKLHSKKIDYFFYFPASKKTSFRESFGLFLENRDKSAAVLSSSPAALFSPAENGDASKTKLNKDDKLMRKNVKAEIDKIMAAQAEARKKALSQQKEDASSDSEDPGDGFVMMPRSS